MTAQCSGPSSSQPALLTSLAAISRQAQERQSQRNLPGQEDSARRPAEKNIDYQAYTQQVVGRLNAPESEPGNGFRQDAGSHRSQQALSAYTAQQQSLEREQLDHVRNLLGVDYFV